MEREDGGPGKQEGRKRRHHREKPRCRGEMEGQETTAPAGTGRLLGKGGVKVKQEPGELAVPPTHFTSDKPKAQGGDTPAQGYTASLHSAQTRVTE